MRSGGLNIRVAVLHHALGRFGGGEKIAILHSIYLSRYGLDIELFYDGPMPPEWKVRVTSSINVRRLPPGLPRSQKHLKDIMELIRYLGSFDVLLVHHHICPFLAYYLSLLFRQRIVWYCGEPLRPLWENWLSSLSYREISCSVKPTSREFYGDRITSLFLSAPLYDLSIYTLRTIDKATVRRYMSVVANSRYTKRVIEEIYGLRNVNVVYPGIEVPQGREDTASPGSWGVEKPYILAVGSMIPMKNYPTLLKAFKYVESRFPEVKLMIIGSGPLEKSIREFAQNLALKNVIFKPYVGEQELGRYYAGCLFIAHVALSEPFGLVPLEAAFYGKPSIVSRDGGISEFVEDGVNGLHVNPHDPVDIAKAMISLLENEGFISEAGLKAREKVLKNFTIETSTRNLIHIIMHSFRQH